MNQRILLTKSWSSFSLEEKINKVNSLNTLRMRERDPRSLRKDKSLKKKAPRKVSKKKEKTLNLSEKALSLFAMLPDDMKKGLL
jgi:hypothetical protein